MLHNGKYCQKEKQVYLGLIVSFFKVRFLKYLFEIVSYVWKDSGSFAEVLLDWLDNQESLKIYKRGPLYTNSMAQFQTLPLYSIYTTQKA